MVFAGRLTDVHSIATAVCAFLSFSLLASSVYVLNDWLDRERDRLHPAKCKRPLASGLVKGPTALMLGLGVLLAGGALGIATTNSSVIALEAIYIAINVAYSWRLKRIILLDVFAIAIGFVIRVWVGAFALQVTASHWLILCTFFLALFLGCGKRENELALLNGASANHRSVLNEYSLRFISEINLIVMTATLICYALYTVAADTVAKFGTDHLVYSVPFVTYGLLRYLYLIRIRSQGGSPEDLVTSDLQLWISVLCWLACCTAVVYFRLGA